MNPFATPTTGKKHKLATLLKNLIAERFKIDEEGFDQVHDLLAGVCTTGRAEFDQHDGVRAFLSRDAEVWKGGITAFANAHGALEGDIWDGLRAAFNQHFKFVKGRPVLRLTNGAAPAAE